MDLVSTEVILAAMIVAFYLKDSLLLLAPDEAVLVRGLGGRWHAGFGARGYKLAGKEPYLANPLTPHAPVVRLAWSMRIAPAPTAPADALALPSSLGWLAPFAWVSWALLFVLIPTTVLARWGVTATLWAVALLYLNIVVALVVVACLRQRLHLSKRAFAMLAFECLVCAPYSANLLRRVAAARPVGEDFTVAAARLLRPQDLEAVHRECLVRIDEQLEELPEDSPGALALRRTRQRFAAAAVTTPEEAA